MTHKTAVNADSVRYMGKQLTRFDAADYVTWRTVPSLLRIGAIRIAFRGIIRLLNK